MRRLAGRYKRFPQFSLAAALANTASAQLPFILLAVLYDRSVTGYFAVAEAMGSIVHNVVATPVAQAYMREAVEAWRSGPLDLRSLYVRTMRKLAIIGLVPVVGLLVGARFVIPVVLGSDWSEAGRYAQVLAFGFYAVFLAQPLSRTLLVMELQPLQLAWDAASLAVTTLALILAERSGLGGYGAVTAYSIALFVVSGSYLLVPLLAIRRTHVGRADVDGSESP
jgi:O-antigen/teichoic acid export membrane protein